MRMNNTHAKKTRTAIDSMDLLDYNTTMLLFDSGLIRSFDNHQQRDNEY